MGDYMSHNLTRLNQKNPNRQGIVTHSIGDMSDVTTTSPADGETLVYDSGSWVNQASSGGGTNGFHRDNVIFTTATLDYALWSQDKDALYYMTSSARVRLPLFDSGVQVGDQVNFVAAWGGNVGVDLEVGMNHMIYANGTAYYASSSTYPYSYTYTNPTAASNFPRRRIYRFIFVGGKTWMHDENG